MMSKVQPVIMQKNCSGLSRIEICAHFKYFSIKIELKKFTNKKKIQP